MAGYFRLLRVTNKAPADLLQQIRLPEEFELCFIVNEWCTQRKYGPRRGSFGRRVD
jgi:hypothetical protein